MEIEAPKKLSDPTIKPQTSEKKGWQPLTSQQKEARENLNNRKDEVSPEKYLFDLVRITGANPFVEK